MKSLVPFTFEGTAVRVIEINGEPWFVLSDVCAVLSIANPRDAASRLDADEKGVGTTDTLGGQQETTIINESGLWSLVLTSRKAAAKRFKKWVTSVVLPTIRKTGSFSIQPMTPQTVKNFNAAARLLGEMRRSVGVREAAKAAHDVLSQIGVRLDPHGTPDALRQRDMFEVIDGGKSKTP